MRPSLSGRSHSLYRAATALYRSATALYSAATAICRYAGSTAGFVHILGLHQTTVFGALLSLHYSSIAAPVVVHWCCPEQRQEPALLRVLRNSPRSMPLFGSPGTPHENKVSYSSPVPADDLRFTCADPALFAPVVVQIVHHVCKTGLFAHVIILF